MNSKIVAKAAEGALIAAEAIGPKAAARVVEVLPNELLTHISTELSGEDEGDTEQ